MNERKDSSYVRRVQMDQAPVFAAQQLHHIDIELTERCNNRCVHCNINRPEQDRGAIERELSTKEWKSILDQAAGLGAISVRFTGGEPLLRSDFVDLYRYARHLGMRVLLFTNARLIRPEIGALLEALPPGEKLEVSIYGMGAQTESAVTGVKASHAQAMAGVRELKKRKIPFVLKWTPLPFNAEDRVAFRKWVKKVMGKDVTPGLNALLELRGRRDSEGANRRIREMRLAPQAAAGMIRAWHPQWEVKMRAFMARMCVPKGVDDRLFSCGAGREASVDAYGKLQPCLLLRDPVLTIDLREHTLEEARRDLFLSLRECRAVHPEYLKRCARCFLRDLCEQCPARSWPEHGRLDRPVEYLCQVAHEQAVQLGLIAVGEKAWNVKNGAARLAARAAAQLPDADISGIMAGGEGKCHE